MKQCKHCNMSYMPSRKNNLYCSTKCKNAFNNERYLRRHSALLQTHDKLKQNAFIVRKYYIQRGSQVFLSELVSRGFDPAFRNYLRPDGHIQVDNWGLEEIAKGTFVIHPPKEFKL